MLKLNLSLLPGLILDLLIVLDSMDLNSSISTQSQSVDSSVRADVNYIPYQFEFGNASRIFWVQGRLNLADPGTKPDTSLTCALQVWFLSGKLPFGFPGLEAGSKDKLLCYLSWEA